MQEEKFEYLIKILAQLSDRQRFIITKKIDGYSHTEIAQLLNVTTRTITREVNDIKKKVEEMMSL